MKALEGNVQLTRIEDRGDDWHAPRRCMREPIPEIAQAAQMLDDAVTAHLAGDRLQTHDLIVAANMPIIRDFTESLWGSAALHPLQADYHRFRNQPAALPILSKVERIALRMPNRAEERAIIGKFGFNCAFCGMPVIRKEVRTAIRQSYPDALGWGSRNPEQHAAFQCMWLQFDHVLPHSRGGTNTIENVVITCAPCNYGRGERTLEELGLLDPRERPVHRTAWDGLERFRP